MKRSNNKKSTSQEGDPSLSPKAGPRRKKNRIMDTSSQEGDQPMAGAKNKKGGGGKGRKRKRNQDKVQVNWLQIIVILHNFKLSLSYVHIDIIIIPSPQQFPSKFFENFGVQQHCFSSPKNNKITKNPQKNLKNISVHTRSVQLFIRNILNVPEHSVPGWDIHDAII